MTDVNRLSDRPNEPSALPSIVVWPDRRPASVGAAAIVAGAVGAAIATSWASRGLGLLLALIGVVLALSVAARRARVTALTVSVGFWPFTHVYAADRVATSRMITGPPSIGFDQMRSIKAAIESQQDVVGPGG